MKSKDGKGFCIAKIGTVCVTVDCQGCRNFTERDECRHGSLLRKCELCVKDDEIAVLRAKVERLRARAVHAGKMLRHYVSGRHECVLPIAISDALDGLDCFDNAGRGEGEA
jgi:hypothetical protein